MKNVQCPHCRKTVLWSSESPYRPFCSERCRLIDLGAWADGSYSIPTSPTPTAGIAPEFDEASQHSLNNTHNMTHPTEDTQEAEEE